MSAGEAYEERGRAFLERLDEPAVAVAGDLMSALILKHTLPNANRTSISLAEWYREIADSGFSLPKLATTDY